MKVREIIVLRWRCPYCGADVRRKGAAENDGTHELRDGERRIYLTCRTCGRKLHVTETDDAGKLFQIRPQCGIANPRRGVSFGRAI
jgi:hypothetical protein